MGVMSKPDELIFSTGAQVGEVQEFPELERGLAVIFERFQGIPPMELMNWLFKRFDEKQMYLWQQGISTWSETLDYPQYAVTKKEDRVFQAVQASRGVDPLNDRQRAYWREWVTDRRDLDVKASLQSPVFEGTPKAPTPPPPSDDTSLATTAYVQNAVKNNVLSVQDIPNTNKGAIYCLSLDLLMQWRQVGLFSGYLSKNVGDIVYGVTPQAKPSEIDLIGGVLSKTTYAGLWAWLKENHHVVPAQEWQQKTFKFADLGGDSFKAPDLRDVFIRFTGNNADTGAVRELGTFQGDAIRNITGRSSGFAYGYGSTRTTEGAIFEESAGRVSGGISGGGVWSATAIAFNASRVVPTGAENRPLNIALHPRMIAF